MRSRLFRGPPHCIGRAQGQDFVRVTENEKPPSVTRYPTGLKRSAFIDFVQPPKVAHYDQRFSGNRAITPFH
jgi:hypothetical protein